MKSNRESEHNVPKGLKAMERFELLPLLREGVQVHYEGSIDKQGGNEDWDWWLYREGSEWVIFDVDGPGCIYNFVQHRYPESEEPTFSFYFDGEAEPRFRIRHSEFGHKAPFTAPLADAYMGPDDNGRGPIRVVRSWVPMEYERSCRITSDIRLKGAAKGDGGWGHVIYHSYREADGIVTFTGQEDLNGLLEMWGHPGEDPKPAGRDAREVAVEQLTLAAGERRVLLDEHDAGCITAILAQWESEPAEPINDFPRPELMQVWICMTWDNHEQADVECPLGAFFGNELGYNRIGLLSHGQAADGQWYQYFPMPYWQSARIELVNRGTAAVELGSWQIRYHAGPQALYPQGRTGYFRSSDYYPSQASHGTDSIIGQIRGRGHLVAGQVTAFSRESGQISCEGDVRVHIDDRATPQVESDGSESWVNYGWGFPTPPEMNPSSGYDGLPDSPWSMVRLCSGDVYPFQQQLVFGIEAGEYNNQYLRHSGILLYYGLDEPGMELTDELDIGCKASEGIHQYRTSGSRGYYTLTSCYEGDQDDVLITDTGHETEGWSEFTVSIRPDNRGVRLRRRSDQMTGQQKATVHVDGILVQERSWYTADRNPYKRWLEDEYEIPAAYTAGKGHVTIRLDYVQAGETRVWNEFYYQVYSLY
ncbi:DUF2961 domain-containing protein [Paenibacillus sp. Z6-24]